MELQRQLDDAHALIDALRGQLAAARAAADANAARADEAWAALLMPVGRQAGPDASRELIEAKREAAAQRARAEAAEAALAAARAEAARGATEEVLAAQRRAAAAEADAAAAADGNAVLQFVAAAELKRVRAAAAAEVAALRAELGRLREKTAPGAPPPVVASHDRGAAEQLWQLVQQQDEALRDLVAQVQALEGKAKAKAQQPQPQTPSEPAEPAPMEDGADDDGVPPPPAPPPASSGGVRRGGVASSLRKGGPPPLRSRWDPLPRP